MRTPPASRHRNHGPAYRHAVILRPLDELHHDQEVAGEPHLVDHRSSISGARHIQDASLYGPLHPGKEFQTLFQTLFRFHDRKSSVVMSPVGNCGRKYSPRRTVTLQRLAISTLFSSASGMSEKAHTSPLRCACTAAMSSCAGVSDRRG